MKNPPKARWECQKFKGTSISSHALTVLAEHGIQFDRQPQGINSELLEWAERVLTMMRYSCSQAQLESEAKHYVLYLSLINLTCCCNFAPFSGLTIATKLAKPAIAAITSVEFPQRLPSIPSFSI